LQRTVLLEPRVPKPARSANKTNSKLPNQRHQSEQPSPGCLLEPELLSSRTTLLPYSSPITPCTQSQPTGEIEPSSSLICDSDSHPHSSAPLLRSPALVPRHSVSARTPPTYHLRGHGVATHYSLARCSSHPFERRYLYTRQTTSFEL
jgi:hypothetical protein